MQYVGGKQKSGGSVIAKFLNGLGLRTISEPFCGGLSVTYRLNFAKIHASDACESLIRMYQMYMQGWRPPLSLSREQWQELKRIQDSTDPLTAFAGFGCSHSGAYFGSYAEKCKRTGDNYVSSAFAAAVSLENKFKKLKNVTFTHCHYEHASDADCLYCDPPYAGTKGYPAVGPFDSEKFWQWARHRSSKTPVFVSEMQAPSDFVPVLTLSVQNRISTKAGQWRSEFLFVHESQMRSAWNV
jgi:site-specific DNA-adenine methylase